MGDSYLEVLVEREFDTKYKVLKIVMYVLCGICILMSLGFSSIMLIVGVALGVIGAFVIPNPDYEYEYLLIGKELAIDKIIAKSKRKTADSFDLNKMELMCPFTSHELDSYKNKKTPVTDYSSAKEGVTPYVMIYKDEKGDRLICLEPNEELLAAVKNVLPRKVVNI